MEAARRELRYALGEGALTVRHPDAAGVLRDVPIQDWHTRTGHDLIASGTVGGFPVRNDPAFLSEARFSDWLFGRPPGSAAPLGDPGALPATLTLMQAVVWIMLRDPGAAGSPALDLTGLVARWDVAGQGADFDGALDEVLDCLREGLLPSWQMAGEAPEPVPARSWVGMLLAPDRHAIAGFAAMPANVRWASVARQVTVQRDRVLSLWPPLPGMLAPRGTVTPERAAFPHRIASEPPVTPRSPGHGTVWLPAASAVYRLAFGIGGEPIVWTHEWGVPPDPWAVEALAARAAGQVWRPDEPPPRPAHSYRAAVRQLMRGKEARGAGQGDPARLLAYAREVAARHAARWAALSAAEDRLTAAVREGILAAYGVPAEAPNAAAGSGPHEPIPPALLSQPGRVIRLNGALCWRGEDPNDFGPHGAGPYYADVRVDAAGLRRLCPPLPLPSAEYVQPWAAISWRAFGAPGERNLGSRPSRLNEPHLPCIETWDEHALRLGAWTALVLAEWELKALLLAGRVAAFGRREAVDPDGQPACQAEGPHAPIPPEVFLNGSLAFDGAGHLFERRTGHYATVRDGRFVPRPLMFLDVRIATARLRAAWAEQRPSMDTADDEPSGSEPQPGDGSDSTPTATTKPAPAFVSPWEAALWRTFGNSEAPKGLMPRSFDHGKVKLPDETDGDHTARVELHGKFDAAEDEVRVLLALGRVTATGREPARTSSGAKLNCPSAATVSIPAETFRNRDLAFGPGGELVQRRPSLARLAAPYEVRGSDADPSIPLYFDVQIPTAELLAIWRPAPDAAKVPVPLEPEVRFRPAAEYSAAALGAWFVLRVRTWPSDAPYPSEEACLTAARAYFGQVPRDEFRRIRREKTPPEWRNPGPRRRRD